MLSRYFVYIPTHPVLWYTLFFLLGIIVGSTPFSPIYLIVASILFLVLVFIWSSFSKQSLAVFFLLIISFFAGIYRFCIAQNHHTLQVDQLTKAPLTAHAIVIEKKTEANKRFKHRITLKTHTITQDTKTIPCHAKIQLYLLFSTPVQIGDTIKVHTLTFKPVKNDSYKQYLFKEGIAATAFIPRLSYTLVDRPRWSFARWRSQVRKRIARRLSQKMNRSTYALLCALFLGTKQHGTAYQTMRAHCSAWGIVHYLARSGLHVVLIVSTWSLLLGLLRINFFLKQLFLIMLIIIYHLLTWPSISFMRALITFLFYKTYILSSFSYQALHVFALTTLFVLLINPYQLFFLDFQLSFGLTFALAWFSEVQTKIRRFHQPDSPSK